MSHLVNPIPLDNVPISLGACQAIVSTLHSYLVRRGQDALKLTPNHVNIATWGRAVKREKVSLSRQDLQEEFRVYLSDQAEHNLIEVINQCATMERLLDLMCWMQSVDSPFTKYSVKRCHPTTSSQKAKKDNVLSDNDLIVVSTFGDEARFEVSDVASEKDGNKKEWKDLASLGVLNGPKSKKKPMEITWPQYQVYLVVSEEFARRIREPRRLWVKGPNPYCVYRETILSPGSTVLFEITRRCPSVEEGAGVLE